MQSWCTVTCQSPDVEVLYVDVLVGSRLPLAPQQKTLLSRGLCREGGRGKKNREIRLSNVNRNQILQSNHETKHVHKCLEQKEKHLYLKTKNDLYTV